MKFDFKQLTDRSDTLELYIYSEVVPDGWDWWTDEKIESETSADFFRKKLKRVPERQIHQSVHKQRRRLGSRRVWHLRTAEKAPGDENGLRRRICQFDCVHYRDVRR
jgi:hypothetical protein